MASTRARRARPWARRTGRTSRRRRRLVRRRTVDCVSGRVLSRRAAASYGTNRFGAGGNGVRLRALAISAFALLAFAFACAPASAEVQSVDHGGNYVGSVIVEPGQVVHGDLNVMGGDATIEGEVDGDVNVVGGNIYQRPGSVITGETNSLGGDVADMVVPWSDQHRYRNPFDYDGKLVWKIVWDVVAVFFFLVFPLRTRMALTRLEQHPGVCAIAGVLGWIAVIPLAIVLVCTILLIPFVAVEFVAVVAAVFLGKAALA